MPLCSGEYEYTTPSPSVIFVSRPTSGSFGGVTRGDTICQNDADAANLGGTYTAWLSTYGVDARDRVVNNPLGYELPSGVTVATGLADLLDGTLRAAITETASGQQSTVTHVWTGTDSYGRLHPGGDNCLDWTSAIELGCIGKTSEINGSWTWYGTTRCTNLRGIYCVRDELEL